jgi:hypothetical protein
MNGSIRTAFLAAIVPALVVAHVALPACADEADALKAAIKAANANVTSLVVDVTTKPGAARVSMHEVVVLPDHLSVTMNVGAMTLETRIIGDTAYVKMSGLPGSGWRKGESHFGDVRKMIADLADPNQRIVVLPDVVIDGATYRRYSTTATIALNGTPTTSTTTCIADAKTLRLAACDNETVHVAFSQYDDPANVVVAPEVDPNAPPLPALPVPLLQRVPSPSPSGSPAPSPAATAAPQGG